MSQGKTARLFRPWSGPQECREEQRAQPPGSPDFPSSASSSSSCSSASSISSSSGTAGNNCGIAGIGPLIQAAGALCGELGPRQVVGPHTYQQQQQQQTCHPLEMQRHWLIDEYRSVQLAVSEISRQEALARHAKKLRPKKFKCDYCPMTFSNNGQLQGHLRIHTGERPFKCSYEGCGKTFTRNEELTRHKRIHTGLRPYACSLCRKKFGRKDHLKKHTKTHETRQLYPTLPQFLPFGFPVSPTTAISLGPHSGPLPAAFFYA